MTTLEKYAGVKEHDIIDKLYHSSAYWAFSTKTSKVFRKPQYEFLKLITSHGHIKPESKNSLTLTREQWSSLLNCPEHNNTTRKLAALSGDIAQVETSRSNEDISMGSVRVTISPAYYFIGNKEKHQKAINDWYAGQWNELKEKNTDFYVSDTYQSNSF